MLLLNPIVAMLHNLQLERWHPIIFHECPLPGPPSADKPVRHKSKSHVTDGFPSRAEAIQCAEQLAEQLKSVALGEIKLCLDKDFPWDGNDIPAKVVFFGQDSEGKVVPMLG